MESMTSQLMTSMTLLYFFAFAMRTHLNLSVFTIAGTFFRIDCNTLDPFGCANQANSILESLLTNIPRLPRHNQTQLLGPRQCEEFARTSQNLNISPAVPTTQHHEICISKATDFPALTQIIVEHLHEMREKEKLSGKSAAAASSSPSSLSQCSCSAFAKKVLENESQLHKCGGCRQAIYCSEGEQNSMVCNASRFKFILIPV